MKIFIENLDFTSFIFNLIKILSCSKLFYIDGNLRLVKFIEKFSKHDYLFKYKNFDK